MTIKNQITGKRVLAARAKEIGLKAGKRRVFNLLLDRKWHNPSEIQAAAGTTVGPAAEGLRRMRELRDFGFMIEKRCVNRAAYQYRMAGCL